MPKRRVVTLDNAATLGLLKQAALIKAFPALKHMSKRLRAQAAGCSSCGRRRAKVRNNVAIDVKKAISNWPDTQKAKLKRLLRVDRIRLVANKKITEF